MMKKRYAAILAIIIIAGFSGCVGQVKGPGIHFGSDKFNFGTVEEGKLVDHTFTFTNNGTETLQVTEVHPTCGCTLSGDFDKEVLPGKSGKIPVTFKSAGFDGSVTKTITVKTNVPDKADVTLTLEGKVNVSVSVNPKVLFLGNVERDRTTPLEGKIAITNKQPAKFKITDVVLSNDNVASSVETLKDGYEYSIGITVRPPFKDGQVMGTVQVITDSKLTPEINAQFSYYLEPMVKTYPNPLFVSLEKIANGELFEINIECQPGPDMQVIDLASNNAKVKPKLVTVEKGRKYKVTLSFPKDFAFDDSNTVLVTFKAKNVPGDPSFTIPVLKM
jgi:hypothetical protein